MGIKGGGPDPLVPPSGSAPDFALRTKYAVVYKVINSIVSLPQNKREYIVIHIQIRISFRYFGTC